MRPEDSALTPDVESLSVEGPVVEPDIVWRDARLVRAAFDRHSHQLLSGEAELPWQNGERGWRAREAGSQPASRGELWGVGVWSLQDWHCGRDKLVAVAVI